MKHRARRRCCELDACARSQIVLFHYIKFTAAVRRDQVNSVWDQCARPGCPQCASLVVLSFAPMSTLSADEGVPSSGKNVVFKKGRARKRRIRTTVSDEDEDTAVIKQTKVDLKGAIKVSTAGASDRPDKNSEFIGKGEIQQVGDSGATRLLEEDTEHDRDKRAQKEAHMNAGGEDDGMYHGIKGYKDWRGVRCPLICH
jgi:hypothetical protein